MKLYILNYKLKLPCWAPTDRGRTEPYECRPIEYDCLYRNWKKCPFGNKHINYNESNWKEGIPDPEEEPIFVNEPHLKSHYADGWEDGYKQRDKEIQDAYKEGKQLFSENKK